MKHLTIALGILFLTIDLSSQVLSPEDFQKQAAKEKGIIIDVRTPEEFEMEHIAQAINVDVRNQNFRTEIGKLDRKKNYFIYCGMGKRSAQAFEIMKEMGFEKVYDLEKGIEEWKAKGLSTEKK